MKKQMIAILAVGLASSATFAQDGHDQRVAKLDQRASEMATPASLDRHAEKVAQSRMDDAMSRLNKKLSSDMEKRVDRQLASRRH